MLTRLLAAALLFGAVACGSGYGTPTAPTDPSISMILFSGTIDDSRTSPGMSATMATAANATATTTSFVAPLPWGSVFSPCAAETVTVTGSLHTLSHTTQHPDGSFNLVIHSNLQGVSGLGTVSGTKCQGTGVHRDQFTVKSSGTFTVTIVNTIRFSAPGPSNNFAVRFNVHVTILGDGRTTANVGNFFSVECK